MIKILLTIVLIEGVFILFDYFITAIVDIYFALIHFIKSRMDEVE